MVEIPEEKLKQLFRGFLKRGAIFWVQQYAPLETGPADKFVIVLNREFTEGRDIHHVLATSKTEKLPFPSFAVLIPAGTLGCFPRDTAIQCREVKSLYYEEFEAKYLTGTLKIKDVLPAEILAKVDAILKTSPYLAPRIAREILA
jgi:hypothetical protein